MVETLIHIMSNCWCLFQKRHLHTRISIYVIDAEQFDKVLRAAVFVSEARSEKVNTDELIAAAVVKIFTRNKIWSNTGPNSEFNLCPF